jgi:hypothetical protein
MQIQDIKINANIHSHNPDSQFFMERLQRRASPSWPSPPHNDIASSTSHGSITAPTTPTMHHRPSSHMESAATVVIGFSGIALPSS